MNIVKGFQIDFVSVPVQSSPPVTKVTHPESKLIIAEVEDLLRKGAIQEVQPSDQGFYSRLFLVPQKEGTYRPVIDLSRLNQYVQNSHFQMEGLHCLKTLLREGDFMTSIDLKDAYFSVAVHASSQRFLRFIWDSKHYAFLGLPFGLSAASRVFTKLLKPVAAFLRKQGYRIIIYLDDFLLLAASREEALHLSQVTLTLLQSTQHINLLELKAAFLALQAFVKDQSHKVVLLKLDNTTAATYVNKMGGTHSVPLMSLALEMWTWCLQRAILISAQHVPGKENTIADTESRVFLDSSDWRLDPQILAPFLANCNTDLFASRFTAQLPQYISWRPDPGAFHIDALTLHWKPLRGYAFPPFNLIPVVLNKVIQDRVDLVLVAPVWQAQPWWPILLSLLINNPVLLPQSPLFAGPIRSRQGTSHVPLSPSHRVSHLQQCYQAEGFPEQVTKLLLSATRSTTRKTYQSAWSRWHSWCSQGKVDPVSAPLPKILEFLANAYSDGLEYRTINVLRSALSSTHPKIDGFLVGQHPHVVKLMKGIINSRPFRPRYSHTWDVRKVTAYISSLGHNKSLTLKQLSRKLVMLFALACPERSSSLAIFDLRYCRVIPEGVVFSLSAPRKCDNPSQLAEALIARFPRSRRLCPVEALRCYLKASRLVRPTVPCSQPDHLFISYVKPHKPVSSATIGRWLRLTLHDAGINTSIFKAHSVRSASTTAAANGNVSLEVIMKMADWSAVSTFQKFYYKPVFSSDYCQAVLQPS